MQANLLQSRVNRSGCKSHKYVTGWNSLNAIAICLWACCAIIFHVFNRAHSGCYDQNSFQHCLCKNLSKSTKTMHLHYRHL
jgi:hypothetical protein